MQGAQSMIDHLLPCVMSIKATLTLSCDVTHSDNDAGDERFLLLRFFLLLLVPFYQTSSFVVAAKRDRYR